LVTAVKQNEYMPILSRRYLSSNQRIYDHFRHG